MSKFVKFEAKGVIYERDKNGNVSGVRATRYGSGVVKTGPELIGKVFRQCSQLLPCDRVSVQTYNL